MGSIAIMQPYLFPYLGYFQLIEAVDTFVIYDDVQFMKGSWINRNRIQIDDQPHSFSMPVEKPSQNRLILEHLRYQPERWNDRFLKTLNRTYAGTPFYENTFALVKSILKCESIDLSSFLQNSLQKLSTHLGLKVRWKCSSTHHDRTISLGGEERVLEICKKENADHYVNLPGGKDLYEKDTFDAFGLRLSFLQPKLLPYADDTGRPFLPALSILDFLMWVPPEEYALHLESYELQ